MKRIFGFVIAIIAWSIAACSVQPAKPPTGGTSTVDNSSRYFVSNDLIFTGDPEQDGFVEIGDGGNAIYIHISNHSILRFEYVTTVQTCVGPAYVFKDSLGRYYTNTMIPGYFCTSVTPQNIWWNFFTGKTVTNNVDPLFMLTNCVTNVSEQKVYFYQTNVCNGSHRIDNFYLYDYAQYIIGNDPLSPSGIGKLYLVYNPRYLYVAHKPLVFDSTATVNGYLNWVFSVIFQGGVDSLNAAGLSAAGISGSFDAGDDIGIDANKNIVSFLRHWKDAPGTPPVQADEAKFYSFVSSALIKHDIDAVYSGDVEHYFVSSNGVMEMGMPWKYQLKDSLTAFFLNMAVNSSNNWVPAENVIDGNFDYWMGLNVNLVNGNAANHIGTILFSEETNADTYNQTPMLYAIQSSVTLRVKLKDADLSSGNVPVINCVLSGAIMSKYSLSLYWNTNESLFMNEIIVATNDPATYSGKNILYFNQNGYIDFVYNDGYQVSRRINIQVADPPGIQVDGYMDVEWNTSPLSVLVTNEFVYSVQGWGDSSFNDYKQIKKNSAVIYENSSVTIKNDIVGMIVFDSSGSTVGNGMGIETVIKTYDYKKALGLGIWVANWSGNTALAVYYDINDGKGGAITGSGNDPYGNRLGINTGVVDGIVFLTKNSEEYYNIGKVWYGSKWQIFDYAVYAKSQNYTQCYWNLAPAWTTNCDDFEFVEIAIDKEVLKTALGFSSPTWVRLRAMMVSLDTGQVYDVIPSKDRLDVSYTYQEYYYCVSNTIDRYYFNSVWQSDSVDRVTNAFPSTVYDVVQAYANYYSTGVYYYYTNTYYYTNYYVTNTFNQISNITTNYIETNWGSWQNQVNMNKVYGSSPIPADGTAEAYPGAATSSILKSINGGYNYYFR